MNLYFLRHGEADWPNWNKPDDARPLTDRGKKEMRKVAAFLKQLGLRVDHIIASPLPRAEQTARIAAEALGLEVHEENLLLSGFSTRELKRLVKKYPGNSVMIVGHEPDFTNVISALTGASLKLSKAGLALVDADIGEERGRLLWLFPPKIAKVTQRD